MADHPRNPTPRREDMRMVLGEGQYTADLQFPGALSAVFIRSPQAHAVIGRIDSAGALAAPGVIAVLTGADLAAEDLGPFAGAPPLGNFATGPLVNGSARPLLAHPRVRFVGDPVALVVAETLAEARSAAELVAVDYAELPAYVDVTEAAAEGAAPIWDEAPGNIAFHYRRGPMDEVEQALAASHHVTILKSRVSRVSAMTMEPRVAVATTDEDGRATIYLSNQSPNQYRLLLAQCFKLPPEDVRVIARDVGGSFGMKVGPLREEAVIFWASRRLGRTIRWVSERSEAFLGDEHARDVEFEVRLGLDRAGNFTALALKYILSPGAYVTSRSAPPIGNIGGIAGVYRTPHIAAEAIGVVTNTQGTGPYRGAGRPEAIFVIERVIDVAARELGIDPFELRRRNLIPPEAMPYKTPFIFEYDCGEFEQTMLKAAALADYAGFARRREEARSRGKLRGIGIANCIEVAAGPLGSIPADFGTLVARSDGSLVYYSGTMSVGQGMETAMPNLIAERLQIPAERIGYVQGDTQLIPRGRGNGGSSALSVGGGAATASVAALIAAGKKLAAGHFHTEADRIDYGGGLFTVGGTNYAMSLAEIAAIAEKEAPGKGLTGEGQFKPEKVTFPNGCHICEVEVDPESGAVEVVSYAACEDVGKVMNVVLVDGQIHGGAAQGIGQALKEEIVFDKASGQVLTGSFMDYGMPLAAELPMFRCANHEVPTKVNPLGVKGVGEAGTVGSLTAAMNAVCDALATAGVRSLDMPASPGRVWQALRMAEPQRRS